MPLRRLVGRERSTEANWQLAALLALAAGVVDVTGFLALRQFSSHMSGSVATIAADFETRGYRVMLAPAEVLVSFLAGAAFCAVLVNWSRRRDRESVYALPILCEAMLLALAVVVHGEWVPLGLLGFSMGLQNAAISKVSNAEIRTTHITGMVTDIGIECGRALYWNRNPLVEPVRADGLRLRLMTMLVGLFFVGGICGALVYPALGMRVLLVVAVGLVVPTVLPILADVRRLRQD